MGEELGETDERPIPPPFMWACDQCVRWLRRLALKWDDPEGCFWEQLRTAEHIAKDHPADVPAQHLDGCELCPYYARRDDGDAGLVWAQHRARGLFMPASLARLM
ncbi:hypothetical protein ACFQ9U_14425 [Streptomyces sp. NPDC056568]|uniref:hypothetical protein n=1 Tax=Streptomyces sp. NPDC056568 TaxID=3345866 RepID=UPI0036A18584